jgi:hypothetical protein
MIVMSFDTPLTRATYLTRRFRRGALMQPGDGAVEQEGAVADDGLDRFGDPQAVAQTVHGVARDVSVGALVRAAHVHVVGDAAHAVDALGGARRRSFLARLSTVPVWVTTPSSAVAPMLHASNIGSSSLSAWTASRNDPRACSNAPIDIDPRRLSASAMASGLPP